MGILGRLYLSLSSSLPFKLAWKRHKHIEFGHPLEGSTVIEKLRGEKHPHTDDFWIYTVTLRECECGLIFSDNGLERRS